MRILQRSLCLSQLFVLNSWFLRIVFAVCMRKEFRFAVGQLTVVVFFFGDDRLFQSYISGPLEDQHSLSEFGTS